MLLLCMLYCLLTKDEIKELINYTDIIVIIIIIIIIIIKPLFDKKGQTKVLYRTCVSPQF